MASTIPTIPATTHAIPNVFSHPGGLRPSKISPKKATVTRATIQPPAHNTPNIANTNITGLIKCQPFRQGLVDVAKSTAVKAAAGAGAGAAGAYLVNAYLVKSLLDSGGK